MAIDRFLNRRRLFSSGAAALLGGAIGFWRRPAQATPSARQVKLISAVRIGDTDGGAVLDEQGLTSFDLPARGHALTRFPDGDVLVVGRRPGTFAALIDPSEPERAPRMFAPLAGHRFAGHAAISADGAMLATSEIDAETGAGTVVMRHPRTGAAKATFAVGIEPHDLLFAAGGERLVVAIGGIARAAEVKGPAINAGKIESAIAEFDPRSGALLKHHVLAPSLQSLSLRHMALAKDGQTVAFGMQDQDRSELRPLMGLLRLGRGVELLPLPDEDAGALRFYIGSVVIDAPGTYLAATSPKGGMAGLWRLADGKWLDGFLLEDVCGLAAGSDAGSFWATSGHGDVIELHANDQGWTAGTHWRVPAAFDNHLLKIERL
jgi:hypothetical protein